MKHFGDIMKINGAAVPPVKVIIGGSPCQDLSVAGGRAGLKGERSGLFMEQIRIIKEMRRADEQNGRTAADIRPRYLVWENVPGAFSSTKGEDFRVVLEEIVGVVQKERPNIPVPKGGWHYAGVVMGDGFSVAWRVFDAQFWGVPQRRRRIALVADFGGSTAPEILFERKSVSRYSPPSQTTWEAFAATINERFGKSDQSRREIEKIITPKAICIQGNCIDRADTAGCNGRGWAEDVSYTLNTVDRPAVYDARGNGNGETVPTITGDHNNRITDYTALCVRERCGCEGGGKGVLVQENKTGALATNNDQFIYSIATRAQSISISNDLSDALLSTDYKGAPAVYANMNEREDTNSPVRRLTPFECERLQGFPDGWTDIGDYVDTKGKKRKTSDSARYKALGNSIALPSWLWLLERLSYLCGADRTMASLFDGIGGFPLIWETINGLGSCLWASEIEEFPIAVTKAHFS